MNVMELFNNREIAAFVWIFIFFIFVLRIKKIRETLVGGFKTIVSVKIIIPVLLLAVYIGSFSYILSRLGLWNIALVKDTIFWFFSAGMITMFKYVTAKKGDVPIKELLLDNLKFIVVLEFIMNTFTFAIWAELLIVPVVTIIVMMNAYVEATKQNRDVAKFLGGIQAIIGLALMGYAFYRALNDYHILGTLDTLRSFLLPIFLSTAIIPIAYLMAVYANYESLFIGFKFGNDKGRGFVNYCKWVIFWNCGLSTKKISKLRPFDLMHLQNKADVKEMLLRLE